MMCHCSFFWFWFCILYFSCDLGISQGLLMYHCHRPGVVGGGCWWGIYPLLTINILSWRFFFFFQMDSSGKKANRYSKLEISWRQDEKKTQDSGPQQPGSCMNPSSGMGSSQIHVGKPFLLPRGYSGHGEQKDTKGREKPQSRIKGRGKGKGTLGIEGAASQAENAQF